MNIVEQIELLAREKLREQEEKDKSKKPDDKSKKPDDKSKDGDKKEIKAKIGSGRVKASVSEAGALARKNPKKLMKNLGVDGAPSADSTEEKVLELVRSAIYGNDVMRQAYTGAKIEKKKDESRVIITPREIDVRSAVKYMEHTLVAAQRVGFLKLDKDVSLERANGVVLIQFA